jgi:DNA-binding GntR family transcriptional regulator
LRILVEAHCIRKFITTLNEHHLQEMEEIVRRSEEALNQNDYSSYYTHSIAFHTYYLSKCQNQRLYSAFTRARNGMRCSQMILDKDPESCTGSINQHKEILQALRKGDPDKCERILRDHVFTNCQMMKRNLESHTRFQRSVGL